MKKHSDDRPDDHVVESLQLEAEYRGRGDRILYHRLVTHRDDDGVIFRVLYAPGGKDTGLTDDAALAAWKRLGGPMPGAREFMKLKARPRKIRLS